jgi:hypothetical protein
MGAMSPRVLLFGAFLQASLLGCATTDRAHGPGSTPDGLVIDLEGDPYLQRVTLAPEPTGTWRVVAIYPPDAELTRPRLRQVFLHLNLNHLVQLPTGERHGHPDLELLADYRSALREPPPDVEAALRGLPYLLHMGSRRQLYLEALAVRPRPLPVVEALVDAVARPDGYLLQRTPDGLTPSGDKVATLADCLEAVLGLDDLAPIHVTRLTQIVPLLDGASAERVISALAAQANPEVLLQSLAFLEPPQRVHALWVLATRPGLSSSDAARVAFSCQELPPAGVIQVLDALAQRAVPPTSDLLAVLGCLPTVESRTAGLEVLVRGRGGNPSDAEFLLATIAGSGSGPRTATLMAQLVSVGRPPLRSVLDVVRRLDGNQERRDVLLALARREDLTPTEAGQIMGAASGIGFDELRADVLVALAGKAPRSELVHAAEALIDPQRDRILEALDGQR